MTIILPPLAVAFAAFCVWLTVRLVNRRERWAKWTAAAVLVLVVYPASLGPAALLCKATGSPMWIQGPLAFIYLPMQGIFECSPEPVKQAYLAYVRKWDERFKDTFF